MGNIILQLPVVYGTESTESTTSCQYIWKIIPTCCHRNKGEVEYITVYAEEVVQVYGFCIRTLRLPVISVMIIGVMRLSYSERAVPDGRFRHHLFQAVFMRTTYPSRYVYFRWSRVHTAVETAVTAPVDM